MGNNNSNNNDPKEDDVLRITSNLHGPKGSIEWIIEYANWLNDKPADFNEAKVSIESPIFQCCGHRWRFQLYPAFKANDKNDEKKENIRIGAYLYLAEDEPEDVVAVTRITFAGDDINNRTQGKEARHQFECEGKIGWGQTRLRSDIQRWAQRSLNGRITIRADITIIMENQFANSHGIGGISIQEASKQQVLNDFQQLLSNQSNW
jgi:hypothetical protein